MLGPLYFDKGTIAGVPGCHGLYYLNITVRDKSADRRGAAVAG
jgi:hypothetical protein